MTDNEYKPRHVCLGSVLRMHLFVCLFVCLRIGFACWVKPLQIRQRERESGRECKGFVVQVFDRVQSLAIDQGFISVGGIALSKLYYLSHVMHI